MQSGRDIFWIVVVHRAGARVFSRNRAADGLIPIYELPRPQGRLRDHELVSDRPGRIYGIRSEAIKHGFSPTHLPHESEAIRFTQELADLLQKARGENKFLGLILVAGPDEMGRLRNALDKLTQEKVLATLTKNLAYTRDIDLEEHLFDALSEAEEKLVFQRPA